MTSPVCQHGNALLLAPDGSGVTRQAYPPCGCASPMLLTEELSGMARSIEPVLGHRSPEGRAAERIERLENALRDIVACAADPRAVAREALAFGALA